MINTSRISLSHWQTRKPPRITSESNQTSSTRGDTGSWNNRIQVFRRVIRPIVWFIRFVLSTSPPCGPCRSEEPRSKYIKARGMGEIAEPTSEDGVEPGFPYYIPILSHPTSADRGTALYANVQLQKGLIGITRRVRGLACPWRCRARWYSDVFFPIMWQPLAV